VSRRAERLVALGLALLAVVPVLPALGCGFVDYDDPRNRPEYSLMLRGLSLDGLRWAFAETDYFANWVPLTVLSQMLDWELWGERAAGHHLTNLLLHGAVTALAFLLWTRATGCSGRAAAVAALFAVHPLRVEPVVWLAGRKDLLSAALSLGALLVYVGWTRRPSLARYLAVGGLLAGALLAKAMAMTVPVLMLLLDLWPLGRLRLPAAGSPRAGTSTAFAAGWPLLREKLALFALAGGFGAVALVTQRESGALVEQAPFAERIANALVSLLRYLVDTVWPAGLSAFYARRPLPPWELAASVVVLVTISAAVWWAARRRPWLAVGWLWWLVALAPVLGLVQVGALSRADRYTYVPSLGLLVALVWSGAELADRWAVPRSARRACVAALGVAAAVASWAQSGHWHDSRALFSRMVAVEPDSYVGHVNLGSVELAAGDVGAAVDHFRRAVAARPNLAPAHSSLGGALRRQGELGAARQSLERAIALDPYFAPAHLNLAMVLDDLGLAGPAAGHLATAVALDPTLLPARQGLLALLTHPATVRQAAPYVLAVARRWPDAAALRTVLAEAARRDRQGRPPEATSPAPRAPAPR
jgi:tetratricopeptide (TPR) repeat protein